MIEPQLWVNDVLEQLQKAFGKRLLYLGLQGSYRRGEATETSDIDLVVLMDAVTLDDLDIYRRIVHGMTEGHKACGFIGSRDDFLHWPRHELFPFKMDTADYYGKLDDFLPPLTKEDTRNAAKISASTLLHTLTHSYLYADDEAKPTILKDVYKSAFFAMQVAHYPATGVYCCNKKDLLSRLADEEKEIIIAGLDFPAWLAARSKEYGEAQARKRAFDMLREWCRKILCGS